METPGWLEQCRFGPVDKAASVMRLAFGFVVFFVVALSLSWSSGAFGAEFWGSDEAAHYVTGVLALDYLKAPSWRPVEVAESFYEHYPKVAIGHWPPMFYLVQGLWMAVFSEARSSALCLMSFLAAVAALLTWRIWRVPLGWASLIACLILLLLPVTQRLTSSVMAEMLVLCWILAAAGQYINYLQEGRTRSSLLFGLFATMAILTKANGLALALVPPLAVLASRRFDLLRRKDFYAPAFVVALICAPWYMATFELAQEGWGRSWDVEVLLENVAVFNTLATIRMVGPLVFCLAITGLAIHVALPLWKGAGARPVWAVTAALAVSVFVFHTFVAPVREERHLVFAAPALIGLSIGAVIEVGRRLHPYRPRVVAAPLVAAFVVGFLVLTFKIPAKRQYGAQPAVSAILAEAAHGDSILVSSVGPEGEGAVVAEVVMRDSRPGLRVMRASKTLAATDWEGRAYQRVVEGPNEIVALLRRESVAFLIVERRNPFNRPVFQHHQMILDTIRDRPGLFQRMSVESDSASVSSLEAYRVRSEPVRR